jgi:site-specific DNA-methyltransferase (adenine-specific)
MNIYSHNNGILIHGDCLTVMEKLIKLNLKVDMILADLPYGTTQNKWDSVLPLDKIWELYEQLIKDKGAIVLTAQTPFDKVLGASNLGLLRYEWIWKKTYHTGHLNAKRMPLKNHENILVFYKHLPTYNPQFTEGEPYKTVVPDDAKTSSNYGKQSGYTIDNKGIRYPRSVVTFDKAKGTFHPTQKPVEMFRYFIRTYTNEREIVLDNVIGSGTTALACELEGRKWIGIEKKEEYIKITNERLSELNKQDE